MTACLARLQRCPRRTGVVTLETLFLLPLLLVVLVGAIGLLGLTVAERTLDEAAGVGARIAAADGTDADVRAAIQAVLGTSRAEHAVTYVVRETPDGRPIPPGGLIEVRIELEARYATATRFARVSPDRMLIGRAVMPRQ
jgi:Flp pilus assembly protein TadG